MSLDLRLAVTDLVVGEMPVHVRCPDEIHAARLGGKKDKTQSLAIYPTNAHCYGCGYNEANWRVVLSILLGIDREEAWALKDRYDSDSLDAYRERVAENTKTNPLPTALAQIYNSVLMRGARKHRLDWLLARGLTEETIGNFLIGHDGNRFTIPVFDGDDLMAFRYRRDDAYLEENYPKYCGMSGRNGQYLYPLDLLVSEPNDLVLFVCEGELDAIRMWQEGLHAVTITNGAGQVKKIPQLLRDRFEGAFQRLVFCTDQDEPGQIAVLGHTNEQGIHVPGAAEIARSLGFETYQLCWSGAKDVTEAIQLGALNPQRWGEYTAVLF
jgi:hypothetical protein